MEMDEFIYIKWPSIYIRKNNPVGALLKTLVNHSFGLAVVVLFLGIFIPNETVKIAAFTYSSITFGFWFTDERRKEDEKKRHSELQKEEMKKERFYLGLVWQELRFNKLRLDEIKTNYRYDLRDRAHFIPSYFKYDRVASQTKLLKSSAYESMMTSGAVVTISSDDVFNALEYAYNNIRQAQASIDTIRGNFGTNVNLIRNINDLTIHKTIIENTEKNITFVAEQIAIASRNVIEAIHQIDSHLNALGTNVEEGELRVSSLTDADKKFIKESLSFVSTGAA